MELRFSDRLGGTAVVPPTENAVTGSWLVLCEGATFDLNRCSPVGPAYLVGAVDGRWEVRDASGGTLAGGRLDPQELPPPVVLAGIDALGSRVAATVGWRARLRQPVLMAARPDLVSKFLQPRRLELELRDHLPHLQEVCRHPRTLLRLDETIEPVDRVKRLAPRAMHHLAAHTEHWEGKGLRSVRPKRILALRAEEELDLYENRVAARLIDRLIAYLHERLREVEPLLKSFQNIRNYSDDLIGTHWLVKRLGTLWAENDEVALQLEEAEGTFRLLRELERELLALMGSPLYRGVPRRAEVATNLNHTNILVNDQHYRHVARLWRLWSRHRQDGLQDETSRQPELQGLCRRYEAYAMGVLMRALDDLGYLPTSDDAVPEAGGARVGLEGPFGSIDLTWTAEGAFRLDGADGAQGPSLVFVPVLAALDGRPDAVGVLATLQVISARAAPEVVVVYPGSPVDATALPVLVRHRLNSLGTDTPPTEPCSASLLPVSPLDLLSVERFGRAVQGWLLSTAYQAYPPAVSDPRASLVPMLADTPWLAATSDGRGLMVLRRPTAREADRWRLACEKSAEGFRAKGKAQRGDVSYLDARRAAIEAAIQKLGPLLVCPVCRTVQDGYGHSFEAEGERGFRATCANCAARWGTRACGNPSCRRRYPFLVTPGDRGARTPGPGWLDVRFGKDVLASPCWGEAVAATYICPYCRRCPKESRTCVRCQGGTPMIREGRP